MTFKLFKSLNSAFLAVTVAVNILFLLAVLPLGGSGVGKSSSELVSISVLAVAALIPLDCVIAVGFSVAASRKFAQISLKLSRDLDTEGFQTANAPILARLKAHPELCHTTLGMAARMNEACALAEAGDLSGAAEILKAVLYDPALQTSRGPRLYAYARALLHMTRLLYGLDRSEDADRCVQELQKLRDGLTEKDAARLRKLLNTLTLRAAAARAMQEGRGEEALRLLRESENEEDQPLEKLRLVCCTAYAHSLSGDARCGKAALDGLDAQAQSLFACVETRRRCGWEE